MTDIELIRELHCYKKMYNCLQGTITECIKTCRDLEAREKLIKAQQDAEDIYTGEEYEHKDLTADERIIIALLSFIMDTEISRVTVADIKIIDNCIKWSLAIQNRKIELSDVFIEEQVNKIFNMANEEKDLEH